MSLLCLILLSFPFRSQQEIIGVGQYSFIIGDTKVTWFVADEWCNNQQHQYELISIHSEAEYNATKLAILQSDPTKSKNYWTGLQHQGTDVTNINTYSWSDGSLFNYAINFGQFPWRANEPNSALSPSCIRLGNTYDYRWDDVDCASTLGGLKAIPICSTTTRSPSKFPTKSPTNMPTYIPTKTPSMSPIITGTGDGTDDEIIIIKTEKSSAIKVVIISLAVVITLGIIITVFVMWKRSHDAQGSKIDQEINTANMKKEAVKTTEIQTKKEEEGTNDSDKTKIGNDNEDSEMEILHDATQNETIVIMRSFNT